MLGFSAGYAYLIGSLLVIVCYAASSRFLKRQEEWRARKLARIISSLIAIGMAVVFLMGVELAINDFLLMVVGALVMYGAFVGIFSYIAIIGFLTIFVAANRVIEPRARVAMIVAGLVCGSVGMGSAVMLAYGVYSVS